MTENTITAAVQEVVRKLSLIQISHLSPEQTKLIDALLSIDLPNIQTKLVKYKTLSNRQLRLHL